MKQLFTLLLGVVAFSLSHAQSELIIEPGPAGTLDQAIIGDTTETGERVDPDRVYVLRRGAPYLTSQSIEWSDYDIHIKAEEGDGARPLIIYNVETGGENIAQIFRLNSGANLTLDGVHISCRNTLGNPVLRAIRMNGDYGSVRINDCVVEEAGQSGFRLNADSIRVYITNSIFNRMGEPTNPNNGRFLDNRGHPIDTIWIENSVIYAVTSRIYRHSGAGRVINGIFNQNTFWGSGQHGFTFGPVDNLTFTNNIVANPVFLGKTRMAPEYVATIDTFISGQTNINMSYNNIFFRDEFSAALPETTVTGDTIYSISDTLFGPVLSAALMEGASATGNFSEVLDFADAPNVPTQFIMAAGDTLDQNGALGNAGDWDFSDLTPNDTYTGLGMGAVERYSEFHDFSYAESSTSFTAGDQGQPVGADLSQMGTNVEEDYFITNSILYYPNPVRQELFIQNLDQADLSTVSIFDLNGKLLLYQKVEASNVVFQVGELPSGTYVLSVRDTAGKVSSRKIVKR